jgi:hypothetical protein
VFQLDIVSQTACRDVFRRASLGLLSWRSHCCGVVAVIVIRRFSSEDSDVGCSGVEILILVTVASVWMLSVFLVITGCKIERLLKMCGFKFGFKFERG